MAGQTTNYLFDYPTSTDYVKDGATAIETLADDVDATLFTALGGAYPGLRLVKKQTIGTGVSSVQITNAFSSTYQNYKILISGGVASAGFVAIEFALDGITSGYYSTLTYQNFSSTTVTGAMANNLSRWNWIGAGTTATLNMNLELLAPNLAKPKISSAIYNEMTITGTNGISRHYNASTTQATGFTITCVSGNITGGTVYVYGFGAS